MGALTTFSYSGGILAAGEDTPAVCESRCQGQGLHKRASPTKKLMMGLSKGKKGDDEVDVCLCGLQQDTTDAPDYGEYKDIYIV